MKVVCTLRSGHGIIKATPTWAFGETLSQGVHFQGNQHHNQTWYFGHDTYSEHDERLKVLQRSIEV